MSSQGSHEGTHGRYLAALSLTALGIVFGDIGTSPIYALRESFHSANGIDPTQANVLGVLSLILWSLIIVISIKYLTFVMRADNHREGGIIALTALVAPPSQAAAVHTTFFLSRETLVAHPQGGMAGWRQRLFGVMARNSLQATVYFGIPPNRVVELGMHVQL